MQQVYRLTRRSAASNASVLLLGRNRHRQGTDRQGHPPSSASARTGPFVRVNCGALERKPARKRAVRPRQRRVHRRASTTAPAGSKRPTAARSSSTKSTPRPPSCRSSCCACCRSANSSASATLKPSASTPGGRGRHQPRPAGRGRGRQLPRGSVLPAQRRADLPAALCASGARTFRNWSAIFWTIYSEENDRYVVAHRPCALEALRLRLARQRSRAAELRRTRRGDGRGRRADAASCCPTAVLGATGPRRMRVSPRTWRASTQELVQQGWPRPAPRRQPALEDRQPRRARADRPGDGRLRRRADQSRRQAGDQPQHAA